MIMNYESNSHWHAKDRAVQQLMQRDADVLDKVGLGRDGAKNNTSAIWSKKNLQRGEGGLCNVFGNFVIFG